MSDRVFGLMLATTPGVGGRSVVRILSRNGLLGRRSAEFLSLAPETLREEYGLGAKAAAALLRDPAGALESAARLDRELSGLGIAMVTAADAHYPRRIEEFDPDPPGVLFMYGNAKLLELPTFSVLASRRAPAAALAQVEALAEAGVLGGEVLVAGHDTPEYQRSAVVPLRWGAPRILCLDRGLFRVLGPELRDEAFRAARLWRYEFDPGTDLAVSGFLPASHFVGVNNKLRDRLVASLSARLDFVHLSPGGNMERLLRLALKAGRRARVSDRVLDYRGWAELGAEVMAAEAKA